MHWKLRASVLAALVLLFATATIAETVGSAKKTNTVITVGEMCGGCVKRITAALEKMPDISGVRCDVKTNTGTVVPRKGKTLSPRTLWEEMEEIGKTPKRLVGPNGTFTSRRKKEEVSEPREPGPNAMASGSGPGFSSLFPFWKASG